VYAEAEAQVKPVHFGPSCLNKTLMKLIFCLLILTCFTVFAPAQNTPPGGEKIKYYDENYFLIEGTTFTDSVKENLYDRFPASYKNKVRPPVWSLSKSSAGISVRFISNSTTVSVKWELLNDTKMNHMAETGIKGIDLYFNNGYTWQYINTARPSGKVNTFLLISNMKAERREYKLYLPLYDGVTKLEVGIDSLCYIEKPPKGSGRPIVFYGTSITQGGCASRPGMVHTSIISRKLNIECINFGFSGNGKMEKPVAELISGIDALFYVMDGTGNMTPKDISDNAVPLVEIIRSKHPATPIVFVECTMFEKAALDEITRNSINEKNDMMKSEYKKMLEKGFKNIYYIENKGALGNDHEATVDAVHFTDLGFLRYADFLISRFRKFRLPLKTRYQD
jgi:hypothetical protein